ncbi:MAG: hypothetical protein K2X81_02100 [Candidatus Obscuribacterales bacterium]|nr:hypothetical protein [Candidatus Obscuribacterales bacterium]
MYTDKPPRKTALKDEYARSDEMRVLKLPPAEPLNKLCHELQTALAAENRSKVQTSSKKIAALVAEAYEIKAPPIRILGERPLEEEGEIIHETFGDYDFESTRIRLWMRTARLGKVTAYGTFLSTLCHEICHHLDVVSFELPNTFHTRGFYERAGLLYHYAKGTEQRPLVWDSLANGTYRINWPKTMRIK